VFSGQGFRNGLASTAGSIISTAQSIASNVTKTINSALDINSPSRVMRKAGGYTGEGFNIGLTDWISTISKTSDKVAQAAMISDSSSGFDINNRVASVSNSTIEHRFTDNLTSGKPMVLNLDIFGRSFTAFVEDISSEQGRATELDYQF
jgi:hypothetical protein